MSFETLPNELSAMVFQPLATNDLRAVSGASRALNTMVEPMLYANLKLATMKSAPLLIRTLLEKPRLGLHFEKITSNQSAFWDQLPATRVMNECRFSKNHQETMRERLEAYMGIDEVREAFNISTYNTTQMVIEDWCGAMSELLRYDQLMAFIILLVPNLKSLRIKGYPTCSKTSQSTIHMVLSAASTMQQKPPKPPPSQNGVTQSRVVERARYSLPKLKALSIGGHHTEDQFETGLLIPFFRMPSLQDLSCNGCRINLYCLLGFTSSLRHLSLTNFRCDKSSLLGSIFPKFKQLESLALKRDNHELRDDEAGDFKLHDVMSSLSHSYDTLQELRVTDQHYLGLQANPSPVLTFAVFGKLRILDLEWHFLDHPIRKSTPPRSRSFDLTNLPPALEQLIIQYAPKRWIRRYLANNLGKLHEAPRLRNIQVSNTKWVVMFEHGDGHEWLRLTGEYQKLGCVLDFPSNLDEYD